MTAVGDGSDTSLIGRRIGEGDRVAVFGAGGGVGIHMIQVAKHHGAAVAGFDVVDEKLAAIEEVCLSRAVVPGQQVAAEQNYSKLLNSSPPGQ